MASSAAAAAAISTKEQWMTEIVHSDVKKDHGPGYNADIVQGFLPENAPAPAAIGGNTISKEDLFNDLIGGLGFYEFLRGVANSGNHGSIALNLFDNPTYEYKVFLKEEESGFSDPAIVQQIQTATRGTLGVGTSFLKISDTTHHTDDIHRLWNNSAATGNPIIQARTRAVQMDAAFKMTSKKVGNDAMFYIEGAPPDNTKSVLYPSYYTNNKLSYLYCKYPVYIKHNGVKNKETLKVGLSYIKNNKSVDIDGDLNTAGFMFKIVKKLGSCFGMSNPDILEAGYIGKHSGDVLQVLDAFRDINLVHYNDTTRKYMHKAGTPSIFETIDINAASKAFSTGIYCIWLHMKDKLVVFTKVIDELAHLREKYTKLYQTVRAKYAILPSIETTLRENRETLLRMITDCNTQFETIITSPYGSYKEFLETCAKYSVFYEKLPLLSERINDLNNKLEEIRELIRLQGHVLIINAVEENIKIYLIVIEQLEEYIRLLNIHLNLDGELAAIRNLLGEMQTIEFNDIIIRNEGDRKEITYGSAFDCIDLDVQNGRSKRILADKFSSAYGLDIINMTYKKLSIELPGGESPSTKHTRFIKKLYSKVPADKKLKFISFVSSVGINVENLEVPTDSPVSTGGSRKTLKKNKRNLRKTYKQKGGNRELVQEILDTLSFFSNIYREKNDNVLRRYINKRFDADIPVTIVNFLPSDTSKVILNIMETYEDIADSLNSGTLKNKIMYIENPILYKYIIPPKKVLNLNWRSVLMTKAKKIKDELNNQRKKTPIIHKISRRPKPLISSAQQAQAAISSPRKSRKKLRE